MAPAPAELPDAEATPKRRPRIRGSLSEAWAVDARHEGCYTGGKVTWSEALGALACLCDEELHFVALEGDVPIRRLRQEADAVLTFAVDPSGQNACTSHRSGLLRHFRLGEPPTLLRSWKAHEQVVADISFDASGSFVATGSVDRTAKVFDFSGYFCTHNFRGHVGIVSLVRFHPARLQLVTVADSEVRLWDLQSSAIVGIMKDHLTSISSMCFGKLKDGTQQLVTGGRDQVVNVWSLEDKCSLAKTCPVFEDVAGVATVSVQELRQACLAKDFDKEPFVHWLKTETKLPSYVILTVGDKCLLRAWNPKDGRCVASLGSPHAAKGSLRQVLCVGQATSRKVVTIGEDMNLVIWSLPQFKVASYIMGHNEEIVHVQLLPQLTWQDGKPATAPSTAPTATPAPGPGITAERFVCIANDEHPRVVNCCGFGAALLRGHTDVVISCDVSVDGQWIATGGKDQSIRVWSSVKCSSVCLLAGHTAAVSALSFPKKRPKGVKGAAAAQTQPWWLVSGSQDKTMKLWELPSPQELAGAAESGEVLHVEKAKVTVIAHAKEVNDVVVAPNNKYIASGGQDKLVRVWSFPETKLLGECKGHRRGVWCVAFSPIDQVIASASGDATVRLWNLKDFTPIRAFQGHTGAVLRVCFLHNGMQLMSSGADGLLKLWQIRTADCAATFDEHTGKVWCIDIVGDRMVSGASDSKLCVWRDSTSEQARERHDAEAELAMKDTRIGLLVKQGKVEQALSLAMELDRPGQMRQILMDYTMDAVSRTLVREGGQNGSGAPTNATETEVTLAAVGPSAPRIDLKRWVSSLSVAHLEKLMGLLEQWNSNRRMASLAQMLLGLVLQAVPPERLMGVEGMNAVCGALLSYSTRHLARVEALLQKTFLFDLVLQSGGAGLSLMADFSKPPPLPLNGTDSLATLDASAPLVDVAEGAMKRTMEVLLGGSVEGDGGGKEQDVEGEDDEQGDEEDGQEDDDMEEPAGLLGDAARDGPLAIHGAAEEAEEEDEVATGVVPSTPSRLQPRKRRRTTGI